MIEARIVSFCNIKGGVGKSTLLIHLSVTLEYLGYKVFIFDMDVNQGTSFQYIMNRIKFIQENEVFIPLPRIKKIFLSNDLENPSYNEDKDKLVNEINRIKDSVDFIIIDTPGSICNASILAIELADLIISPLTESFMDLGALFWKEFDHNKDKYIPSIYLEKIWEIRRKKIARNKRLDWVIAMNKIGNINTSNKKSIYNILHKFSQILGFNVESALFERTVFKEMFDQGTIILDFYKNNIPSNFINVSVSSEEIINFTRNILNHTNINRRGEKRI